MLPLMSWRSTSLVFIYISDKLLCFICYLIIFTCCVENGCFLCCEGSVLSGGGSVPAPKASAEAWVNMVNEIQKASLSTRLAIPMLYGIDAVHGHNNVYNATIFPHNVGLGVTRQVNFSLFIWMTDIIFNFFDFYYQFRDPQLIKKIGEATALEVRATGIPYAFSPCIAVNYTMQPQFLLHVSWNLIN